MMIETIDSSCELSLQNALGYRALSIGFLYPNEFQLSRLNRMIDEAIDCGKSASNRCWDSLRDLKPLIAIPLDEINIENLKNLQQEHYRLFGPNPLVPLDLAHYLSENPFEQSKKMADMAGFYRAFGVDCQSGNRVDNISVLFEFLSYLHLKRLNARQKKLKDQEEISENAIRSFVRDFLLEGIGAFQKRLSVNSGQNFYNLLGKIALKSVVGGSL